MLSDVDIRQAVKDGQLRISPFRDELVQPASIDLLLGPYFTGRADFGDRGEISTYLRVIDPRREDGYLTWQLGRDEYFDLLPGYTLLAATHERVGFSPALSGQVVGKSSLARLGLQVHCAGLCDPGWSGHITLELVNLNSAPIRLIPGMKIAQLVVTRMDTPASVVYGDESLGSHYQDQPPYPVPYRGHGFRTYDVWSNDGS